MIKELHFKKVSQTRPLEEQFQNAQVELGFSLPPVFVEFCRRYNGGYPLPQNSFFPVPQTFLEFHQEYGECPGVMTDGLLGLSEEIVDCNALFEFKQLQEDSQITLLPIAFDLFGNQAVLLAQEPEGKVFWRDHELWDGDVPRLFCIAYQLEEFYNGLVSPPPDLAT